MVDGKNISVIISYPTILSMQLFNSVQLRPDIEEGFNGKLFNSDHSRRSCPHVSALGVFHTLCAVERVFLGPIGHRPRCSQDCRLGV
jgi:hypothetical protein